MNDEILISKIYKILDNNNNEFISYVRDIMLNNNTTNIEEYEFYKKIYIIVDELNMSSEKSAEIVSDIFFNYFKKHERERKIKKYIN